MVIPRLILICIFKLKELARTHNYPLGVPDVDLDMYKTSKNVDGVFHGQVDWDGNLKRREVVKVN